MFRVLTVKAKPVSSAGLACPLDHHHRHFVTFSSWTCPENVEVETSEVNFQNFKTTFKHPMLYAWIGEPGAYIRQGVVAAVSKFKEPSQKASESRGLPSQKTIVEALWKFGDGVTMVTVLKEYRSGRNSAEQCAKKCVQGKRSAGTVCTTCV